MSDLNRLSLSAKLSGTDKNDFDGNVYTSIAQADATLTQY